MVFPDHFKNHILPDKLHTLNVSFNITSLKTHFGGTAGNIAFYLKMLGEDPLIIATAGSDFGPYADWLDRHEISRDGIRILEDVRTAQGFVTTDLDHSQIWAFYEGAMARAHEARVEDAEGEASFAIVTANGKQAMIEHGRKLKERGIATYIDPSHGLPILDSYEWSLTLEKTGCSEDELFSRCDAVVITEGAKGSVIHTGSEKIEIPPVVAPNVVDPTGCGDAYRSSRTRSQAASEACWAPTRWESREPRISCSTSRNSTPASSANSASVCERGDRVRLGRRRLSELRLSAAGVDRCERRRRRCRGSRPRRRCCVGALWAFRDRHRAQFGDRAGDQCPQ